MLKNKANAGKSKKNKKNMVFYYNPDLITNLLTESAWKHQRRSESCINTG